MSDAPEEGAPDAPDEAAGEVVPVDADERTFRIHGSDGSERYPYPSLEHAQAAKAWLEGFSGEDVTFRIHDQGGEPV